MELKTKYMIEGIVDMIVALSVILIDAYIIFKFEKIELISSPQELLIILLLTLLITGMGMYFWNRGWDLVNEARGMEALNG